MVDWIDDEAIRWHGRFFSVGDRVKRRTYKAHVAGTISSFGGWTAFIRWDDGTHSNIAVMDRSPRAFAHIDEVPVLRASEV